MKLDVRARWRLSLLLLAALAFPAGAARSADQAHPIFEFDSSWPKQLPNGYFFGQIAGLATDAKGNVWIFSRPRAVVPQLEDPPQERSGIPAPSVVQISPDGTFLRGWGGPFLMSGQDRAQFEWPAQEHGIGPDNRGHVWLCGNGRDQTTKKEDNHCLKFTEDGKFVLQVGRSGASTGSLDMENFRRASQPVYWAKANEVFVSDGYGNRRVVVIDADSGKFKRIWGAYGKKPDDTVELVRQYEPPPSQFNLAHALAISADGIVYLSDRNNNRIQSFSLDGKFLKEGVVQKSTPMDRGFGTVFSAALSGDPEQRFLYVADGRQQKVRVLDRKSLEEIPGGAFGRVGQYPGQFLGMHVIATDPQGNIYVGDGRDGRVQKFVFKGLSK